MHRPNQTGGGGQYDSRVFISVAVSASGLLRMASSSPTITTQKPKIGRDILTVDLTLLALQKGLHKSELKRVSVSPSPAGGGLG